MDRSTVAHPAPFGSAADPAATAEEGSRAVPASLVRLCADDGRMLAATWHEPPLGAARAVAVISSAAGVPRGYYRGFAEWLAQRGYAVLSYDYRGIGDSRQGPVRADSATMREWALLDMPAALAAAEVRRGQGQALPLLLVGHSFGGNSIAFAPGVERADALLTVASQLGETRLYPGVHRWVARTFFGAWLPAVVALAGHAPGWSLGGGAQPLPAGVARDWWRWGRTPGWAYGAAEMQGLQRTAQIRVPVHLWNVSDDLTYAPPRAVDALAALFDHAPVQRHAITPQALGLRRLGHFGAFRREPGPRLWRQLLAPLEAAVPALPTPLTPAAS